MRTPEFIQRCMAAGMPLDMALLAAKAFEAECELAVGEVLESRRAKERARQAKHRAKNNECHVMSRDETLSGGLQRDLTGECSQVVTPSLSSLPSEVQKELKPPVKPNGLTAPKGAARRLRLVPEAWAPSAKVLSDLVGLGFVSGEIERELSTFRDHEFRDPKSDFDRAFRTWMKRSRIFRTGQPHERPNADAKLEARHANYARAWEGSERAFGRDGKP